MSTENPNRILDHQYSTRLGFQHQKQPVCKLKMQQIPLFWLPKGSLSDFFNGLDFFCDESTDKSQRIISEKVRVGENKRYLIVLLIGSSICPRL
jgi:hypothetical protein